MRKSILTSAALAVALSCLASPASADVAVTGFTGGSTNNTSGQDLPFTVGFSFTPTADVTLTQLGLWDVNGDGFVDTHQIGVWDSGGILLLSDLIPSGTAATLLDGFRYIDSTDLGLFAGQTYTIGAVMFESSTTDAYVFGPSSVSTDALITFGFGVRSGDDSGFAFPDQTPNTGRFGPNFQFTAGAIPEPGTWAMMLLGFGTIGIAIRRSRRSLATA